MIQAAGLLLAGVAAAALMLAGRFQIVLAAWTAGAVIHAGLAASGRGRDCGVVARRALLVEVLGAWALALGGLALVLASGTGEVNLMAPNLVPLAPDHPVLGWAGLGLLVAVLARLGLPPLPWWPAETAGAPASVRIFLHAGLHPATALLLWSRLEPWLLPWHRALALWLAAIAAVILTVAALAERQRARRAAWFGSGRWACLLAAAAAGDGAPWSIWTLAAALALVHLVAAVPRLSAVRSRALLGVGGAAALLVGAPGLPLGGVGFAADARWPAVLVLMATVLAVPVLVRRRTPLPAARRVARLTQGPGPLYRLTEASARGLARVAAEIDRIVLGGVVEGLGWMGLGAGWLAAWIDRRGLDALDRGAAVAVTAVGRSCARAAGGRSWRVLAWAVVTAAALAVLGWSLG